MIEFCVQGSINPEALWVKPLLEQGRRWERCKPVLLLIREKYPVVKKRSRKLEMVSNLQLQKIALKVRRDGSQASIFVRTFRSFTISQVAREAGVTRKTIRKGLQEVEAGALYEPGDRIRRKGGGRKQITAKDETLRADLEDLLEPKGDPQSLVRWTTKSMSKLKEALKSQGHTIGETAIRELLKGMGFSLKANKKAIEGTAHADRDAQFQQINRTGKAFEAEGLPMISVDCKKKELIGNFKNHGREWQAKGQNTTVNVYDYRSIADGKAVPSGIYDVVHNSGFGSAGH